MISFSFVVLGQTSERIRDPSMQTADMMNSDCMIHGLITCFTGCGWMYVFPSNCFRLIPVLIVISATACSSEPRSVNATTSREADATTAVYHSGAHAALSSNRITKSRFANKMPSLLLKATSRNQACKCQRPPTRRNTDPSARDL